MLINKHYRSKESTRYRGRETSCVNRMTTAVCPQVTQYLQLQTEVYGPRQHVKGDPKDTVPVPFHEPLENATHTVFRVQGPVSSSPKRFSVNIFNGSNGAKIPVIVNRLDTIAKLLQKVLKLRPDLGASLNLVLNGKPVELHKTLSELQVKPGATFITYQKCHGG